MKQILKSGLKVVKNRIEALVIKVEVKEWIQDIL